MRPMTAREALSILRTIGNGGTQAEYAQARRILDALVEWREAKLDRDARIAASEDSNRTESMREWMLAAYGRVHAAETKLAALERGEEPEEN